VSEFCEKSDVETQTESAAEVKAMEFLAGGRQWNDNGYVLLNARRNRENLFEWFEAEGIDPVIGTKILISREVSDIRLFDLANTFPTGNRDAERLLELIYEMVPTLYLKYPDCYPDRISTGDFLAEKDNQAILDLFKIQLSCRSQGLMFFLRAQLGVDDPIKFMQKIIERTEDPIVLYLLFRDEDAVMPIVIQAFEKIGSLLAEAGAPDPLEFLEGLGRAWQITKALESDKMSYDPCMWLMENGIEPYNAIQLAIERAEYPHAIHELVWDHKLELPHDFVMELRKLCSEKEESLTSSAQIVQDGGAPGNDVKGN
jgi:hypothetical protein